MSTAHAGRMDRRRRDARFVRWNALRVGAAVAGLMLVSGSLAAQDVHRDIILRAQSYLGMQYCTGGTAPTCFDCSGFVVHLYRQYVDNLPRISRDMARTGTPVRREELLPGDLLFFATGPRAGAITHVAIYMGQDSIIHAISDGPNRGIAVTPLSANYWRTRFHSAARVLVPPASSGGSAAGPAPSPATSGGSAPTPTPAPAPAAPAAKPHPTFPAHTEEPIQFARGSYTGQLQNGEPHGRGAMVFRNGDRYEGEFRRGAFEGTGTYLWRDGSRYEGEFSADAITGRGRLVAANGQVTAGLWRDGVLVQAEGAAGRGQQPRSYRAPSPYDAVAESPWQTYNGLVMGDFYAWQQSERDAFQEWRRSN